MTDTPKVLIVDDDKISRKVIKKTFEEHGFEVDMASSGMECLDKVVSKPYDLILLDAMMNDLDGFETCKKLKDNKATADIPVIFVSALVSKDDILKSYKAGATDYIPKPMDRQITIAKAKAIINTRQLAQDKKNLMRINRAVLGKLDELFKDLAIISKINTARQEVMESSTEFFNLLDKLRTDIDSVVSTMNSVELGMQFTDRTSQMLNELGVITTKIHRLMYGEESPDADGITEKLSTGSAFNKKISQSEVDDLLRSLNVEP